MGEMSIEFRLNRLAAKFLNRGGSWAGERNKKQIKIVKPWTRHEIIQLRLLGTLPVEPAERDLIQDKLARLDIGDGPVADYSVGWTWSRKPIRSGRYSRWPRNSIRRP